MYIRDKKSALGELRSATSTLQTVLLSLLHSGVTSEEACLLEKGLVSLISGKERTSYAVTDSTCLTGEAAAANVCNDIELAGGLGYAEGLVNDILKSFKTKIVVYVSAVDGNNAGTGIKTNSSYGLLSTACSVEIRLSTCIQST